MKILLYCEVPLVPPSVNTYWGFKGSMRYLTASAKRFTKDLGNWVPSKMSDKRLRLDLTFCYPDRRVRDLDNNLKPLIDSLVKCGLFVDDGQIDEINVKRGEVVKGGMIYITVYELN